MFLNNLQIIVLYFVIVITRIICLSDSVPLKSLRLYTPYSFVYGQPKRVLVTLKNLGSKKFRLELSTPHYLMLNLLTNPNVSMHAQSWHKTNDLRVTLDFFKLNEEVPDYSTAFYQVIESTHWIVGETDLKATIIDSKSADRIVTINRKVYVLKPQSVTCVPQLVFRSCMNFKEPMILDQARENTLNAYFLQNCNNTKRFVYHWQIYEIPETVPYTVFARTIEPELIIEKYHLTNRPVENEEDVDSSFSPVYALHVQGHKIKNPSQSVATRCYITIVKRPVQAIIAGGTQRTVSVKQKIMFSGQDSRDYARSPRKRQFLNFIWHCRTNDDVNNTHCRYNLGRSDMLKLPAKALKWGNRYNFTLTVFSNQNRYLNSSMTQQVVVVDSPQAYVDLHCQWNCAMNEFSVDEPLYVEAKCLNCNSKAKLMYQWTLNERPLDGNRNGNNVILKLNSSYEHVDLEVELFAFENRQSSLVGRAKLALKRNYGPTGGECHINPESGNVFDTFFNISCQAYNTEHRPLDYRFRANDLLLHSQFENGKCSLQLPETDYIVVEICDILHVCRTEKLQVLLKPLFVPLNIDERRNFMRTNLAKIEDLFQRGDRERALLLNYVLIQRTMRGDDTDALIKNILEQKIDTVQQLDQLVEMTHALLAKLIPLNDKKVKSLTDIFRKITASYLFVSSKENAWQANKKTFYKISEKMLKIFAEFSKASEVIPLPQCTVDAAGFFENHLAVISDEYENFPDFDLKVIERISVWLDANWYLDKNIFYLGQAGASIKTSEGVPLSITHNGMEMKLQTYRGEMQTKQQIFMNDGANRIKLMPDLINYLRYRFQSETVSIQALLLTSNQYWWYPDCQGLSTRVLSVNAFAGTAGLKHQAILDTSIDIYLKLIENKDVNVDKDLKSNNGTEIGVTETADSDKDENESHSFEVVEAFRNSGGFYSIYNIEIYSTMLPENSQMALRFFDIKMDIRALVKLHTRPTIVELKSNSCILKMNSKRTILIQNHCNTSRVFIGLMPIDSDIKIDNINRTSFSFMLEVRQCNSWMYELANPRWSPTYCQPALVYKLKDKIHCRCKHLSAYSATIYHAIANHLVFDPRYDEVSIKPLIIVFVALFLCLLLLCCTKGSRNLTIENNTKSKDGIGNIIIEINTGGLFDSGTTANVTLTFISLQAGEHELRILQDPFARQLTTNSTVMLRISDKDIRLPTLIAISHDGNGHSSAWFIRSIVITDLKRNEKQIFRIEKWVKKYNYYAYSFDYTKTKYSIPAYKWWGRFRIYIEQWFINWFLLQPLFGPWRYGSTNICLSRNQRICIWLSKIAFVFCICFCWLGPTDTKHYMSDRRTDISAPTVMLVALVCFFSGILIELFFIRFIILIIIEGGGP